MAHHTRIRKDSAWVVGPTWTDAERLALDAALTASLNGDGGGTWEPSSNIVLGAAGLKLLATTHTISGSGAAIATSISGGKRLVHGDSDYCTLAVGHAASTRLITSPIDRAVFAAGWTVGDGVLLSTQYGATARVPLNLHDKAVLNVVNFQWLIGVNTGECPDATPPRFGVFAQDGNGVKYPLSLSAPYQGVAPFTSVSAWYGSGRPQTFQYLVDATTTNPLVAIDTARFTYFAEIVEASSVVQSNFLGATWFQDVQSYLIDIHDLGPQ